MNRKTSKKFNWDKWAAIGSLITAFFVGLQLYDSHQQYIDVTKSFVSVELEEDPQDTMGIKLLNSGTTPLTIQSLAYYVDNKRMETWEDLEKQVHLSDEHIMHYEWDDDTNDYLAAASSLWLLKYENDGKEINPQKLQNFIDFLDRRVGIEIKYCSIRNECLKKCSTKHKCND